MPKAKDQLCEDTIRSIEALRSDPASDRYDFDALLRPETWLSREKLEQAGIVFVEVEPPVAEAYRGTLEEPSPYREGDRRGAEKTRLASRLATVPPLPEGPYSLILADPPWRYRLRETDASHRGRTPYPSMSDEEILSLPIGELAARDAYLLLWTTNNHLPLAFQCLERWGFRYKTTHSWIKVCSKDRAKPAIGVGHYGRNCSEHFLVALRGEPKSWSALGLTNIPTAILAPRRQHSQKPEEFYRLSAKLLNRLGGRAIELFARQPREWDVWGLEASRC